MRKIVLSSQALISMDVSQVQGLSFKLSWPQKGAFVLIADFWPLLEHLLTGYSETLRVQLVSEVRTLPK